jgi:hypothetical protein
MKMNDSTSFISKESIHHVNSKCVFFIFCHQLILYLFFFEQVIRLKSPLQEEKLQQVNCSLCQVLIKNRKKNNMKDFAD